MGIIVNENKILDNGLVVYGFYVTTHGLFRVIKDWGKYWIVYNEVWKSSKENPLSIRNEEVRLEVNEAELGSNMWHLIYDDIRSRFTPSAIVNDA